MLAWPLAVSEMGEAPRFVFSADQVLSNYIYIFMISFVVAFVFTPVMRRVANYYGIVDQPDRLRKMHSKPVAYLGGVAVFVAWMAGLAVSQFIRVHYQGMLKNPLTTVHVTIPMSIVLGATVIVLLGLWDDLRRIRPSLKIAGQLLAASFLLYQGIGTHCLGPAFEPINERLTVWYGTQVPPGIITAASSILVLFAVVGCCNATNLMDGLDGLCGGVTAIIVAGFLFLAVVIARYGGLYSVLPDFNTDALRVVLALALLGGVLGFVPFNFNPASIFMGDTGSMFLGFCCAVLIILAGEGTHPKWFLASMVMFALPVLDTALAFGRRWVKKRPLFSADRQHFHHQLVERGFSVKQTVVIAYGLALVFAGCGAAVVFMRARYAVAFYLVLFGYLLVAAFKMGMVHERVRIVSRSPMDETAANTASALIEPGAVLEIREESVQLAVSDRDVAGTGVDAATGDGVLPANRAVAPATADRQTPQGSFNTQS